MTLEELRTLNVGDLVRRAGLHDGIAFVVTANYGNRVTAVRTVDITNPNEWVLVSKAQHDK